MLIIAIGLAMFAGVTLLPAAGLTLVACHYGMAARRIQ